MLPTTRPIEVRISGIDYFVERLEFAAATQILNLDSSVLANSTMGTFVLPRWGHWGGNNRQGREYAELVRLRGATVTMLQTQRISVHEARRLRALLNAARQAVDAGRLGVADTKLAAVRTYLKARQGEPV